MPFYNHISPRLVFLSTSFLCILLLTIPAYAENHLSLHANAGATWQSWDSGLENATIKVETESMRALRLEGRLSWRGRTLISLAHSRSLQDSATQQEILAASGEQSNSLEETLGIVDLLAWVAGGEAARNGELSFLHRLAGVRVSYTHDLHFGNTVSPGDFYHLGFSGEENAVLYQFGDQLAFRTLFRDLRVMTPVWFDPLYLGSVIRVGYFRSQWEKVSSTPGHILDGDPVVQDTRRDTSGLTLSYDNSLDWPGVGWGLSLDLGLFGTGLERPEVIDEQYEPTYSALRAEIRWNLGHDDGRSGLAASLGAAIDVRQWKQGGYPLDRDLLTKVFARLGFDLAL